MCPGGSGACRACIRRITGATWDSCVAAFFFSLCRVSAGLFWGVALLLLHLPFCDGEVTRVTGCVPVMGWTVGLLRRARDIHLVVDFCAVVCAMRKAWWADAMADVAAGQLVGYLYLHSLPDDAHTLASSCLDEALPLFLVAEKCFAECTVCIPLPHPVGGPPSSAVGPSKVAVSCFVSALSIQLPRRHWPVPVRGFVICTWL